MTYVSNGPVVLVVYEEHTVSVNSWLTVWEWFREWV